MHPFQCCDSRMFQICMMCHGSMVEDVQRSWIKLSSLHCTVKALLESSVGYTNCTFLRVCFWCSWTRRPRTAPEKHRKHTLRKVQFVYPTEQNKRSGQYHAPNRVPCSRRMVDLWWTRKRSVKVQGPRDVSDFAWSPLSLYVKMRKTFPVRHVPPIWSGSAG